MAGEDTRERILDAAERLFAERGFAATSIRDVTAEASVNLAAVHYHFGSKDDLIRAVFERIVVPANERRLAMMAEAEERTGGPSVEELLRAFMLPEFEMLNELGERGPAAGRLMGRMLSEPNDSIHGLVMDLFSEVGGRFIEGLQRALPDIPPEEVVLRMQCVVAVLSFFMGNTIPSQWRVLEASDPEGTTERIVSVLLPAVCAPAPGLEKGGVDSSM